MIGDGDGLFTTAGEEFPFVVAEVVVGPNIVFRLLLGWAIHMQVALESWIRFFQSRHWNLASWLTGLFPNSKTI
jgi:hypothetical protein